MWCCHVVICCVVADAAYVDAAFLFTCAAAVVAYGVDADAESSVDVYICCCC